MASCPPTTSVWSVCKYLITLQPLFTVRIRETSLLLLIKIREGGTLDRLIVCILNNLKPS